MFKTSINLAQNPQRNARTASPTKVARIRVSFDKNRRRQNDSLNHSNLRPFTSPLIDRKYQTLDQTGRTSHLMNLSSIDTVENQLKSEYREEMCGYLRNKLKYLVSKRQEDIAYDRYLNNTIENTEFETTAHSTIGPLDQFYSVFNEKKRIKVQKGVDEVYVFNAKEQIHRLIDRKREQQNDFNQLRHSITIKRQVEQRRKSIKLRDEFKVTNVVDEDWDKQWRQSTQKERKRYRNRLVMKWNRQNSISLQVKLKN